MYRSHYERRTQDRFYERQRTSNFYHNMQTTYTRSYNQRMDAQRSSWQMSQQHSRQAEARSCEFYQWSDRNRSELAKLSEGVDFSGITTGIEAAITSLPATVTGFFQRGVTEVKETCKSTYKGCEAIAEVLSDIPDGIRWTNEIRYAADNHFCPMKTTFVREEQEELRALTLIEVAGFGLSEYRGELVTVKRTKPGLEKPDLCLFNDVQYEWKEPTVILPQIPLTDEEVEEWFEERAQMHIDLDQEIKRRKTALDGFTITCKLDTVVILDHLDFLKRNGVEHKTLIHLPRMLEIVRRKPIKIFEKINLSKLTEEQKRVFYRVYREVILTPPETYDPNHKPTAKEISDYLQAEQYKGIEEVLSEEKLRTFPNFV